MCVCVYVCVYIYMCVYIYIYIYIYYNLAINDLQEEIFSGGMAKGLEVRKFELYLRYYILLKPS